MAKVCKMILISGAFHHPSENGCCQKICKISQSPAKYRKKYCNHPAVLLCAVALREECAVLAARMIAEGDELGVVGTNPDAA